MPTKIFTIGHSNKTGDELVEKLRVNAIDTVVDVRSVPASRWNPQFNQAALVQSFSQASTNYEFRGKNLGGRDENVDYQETIDDLAKRARAGERIAVMCSEGPIKECHRKSMLTPSFHAAGLIVEHILWKSDNQIDEPAEDLLTGLEG